MNSDEFQSFLKATLPAMGYCWRRFDRRNIKRRIRLRMESLRIFELEKYTEMINRDEVERAAFDLLLRLTITRFFRNRELWLDLKTLITGWDKDITDGKTLKIWSAGCAGGEEAFSAAMLLDDLARSGHMENPWTVLGTDADPASLSRAKTAAYKWGSVREVPDHLRARWLEEEDGSWTLDQEVRNMVTLDRHDLVSMDPRGRFHIVFLRNSILTYNTDEVQRKVLDRIHNCLLTPGYLVIGRTEKLPEGVGFEEVSKCIYRKT